MRPSVALSVLLLVLAASGCGERSVYLRSDVYCHLTGAKGRIEVKVSNGHNEYTSAIVSGAAAMLEGRTATADERLRRLAVRYIVDVSEAANQGRGKLRIVSASKSDTHLWAPVQGFTRCKRTGTYSAKGVTFPLFPSGSDSGQFEWEPVGYEEFMSAARAWLAQAGSGD